MEVFTESILFVLKWLSLLLLAIIVGYFLGRSISAGVMRSIQEARKKPTKRSDTNGT